MGTERARQHFLHLCAGIACGVVFVLFGTQSVSAFGLSPPEVHLAQTLTSSTSSVETVRLQRGASDTGSLFFEVDLHGQCDACIQGASYIIMPSTADAVEYQFTVSSTSTLATGSYVEYIAFTLVRDGETADGTRVGVVQGVTATVRFSVTGTTTTTSSGGGGGGGSSRRSSSSTSSGTDVDDSGDDGSGGTSDSDSADGTTGTESHTDGASAADEGSDDGEAEGDADDGDGGDDSASSEAAEGDADDGGEADSGATGDAAASGDSDAARDGAVASVAAESTAIASASGSDGQASIADVAARFAAYVTGQCNGGCDADGDGAVTFADIVRYAADAAIDDDRPTALPPIAPGPPLPTDDVVFYFQPGDVYGGFDFVLASVEETDADDYVTFYLLVDTGPSGIIAADVAFTYDPESMRFVGFDTVGSVFAMAETSSGAGEVRFSGISSASFAGTRGYLASVQFEPLQEGESALVFTEVEAYHYGVLAPPVVEAQSLVGQLVANEETADERVVVIGEATSEAASEPMVMIIDPEEAAAADAVCGCFRSDRRAVCVLLALLLTIALAGLLSLLRYHVKYAKLPLTGKHD